MGFLQISSEEEYLFENDKGYLERKLTFAKVFGLIAFVLYFSYAVINLVTQDYWAFSVELVCTVLISYALYNVFRYKKPYPAISIGLITAMIILWQNFYSGGFAGTGIFWLFMWPIVAFFLGGLRNGKYVSLIFFAGLVFLYVLTKIGIFPTNYTDFTLFMVLLALLINSTILTVVQKTVYSYMIKLVEARNRVSELSTLRQRFIDLMAMQLKNPLGAARWSSELLLDSKFNSEEEVLVKDTYASITTVIDRLDDMVAAVHINNEDIEIKNDRVNLPRLVTSVVRKLKKAFPEKNVLLDISGFDSEKFIQTDQEKTKTIVNAVIDNGFRYTDNDGEVKVSLKRDGESISLVVMDNGIGIPKDEIGNIFDIFVRGSNANSINPHGTGIGLYVSKQFADLLNIEILVESNEDGTISTVNF